MTHFGYYRGGFADPASSVAQIEVGSKSWVDAPLFCTVSRRYPQILVLHGHARYARSLTMVVDFIQECISGLRAMVHCTVLY